MDEVITICIKLDYYLNTIYLTITIMKKLFNNKTNKDEYLLTNNKTSKKNISDIELSVIYKHSKAIKEQPIWQFFLDTHHTRNDIGWWRKSHSVI